MYWNKQTGMIHAQNHLLGIFWQHLSKKPRSSYEEDSGFSRNDNAYKYARNVFYPHIADRLGMICFFLLMILGRNTSLYFGVTPNAWLITSSLPM